MMIHRVNGQNMFRTQMQNPSLQKIIGQINANFSNKAKFDTVELSQKAQNLLNDKKNEKIDEVKQSKESMAYQKNPTGISKVEWAKNALSAQRDGIKTISDIIDYAKSRLDFTMSKMEELENFLNGTGSHSDPNMTQEVAETYLNNYKQSIQSDYTYVINSHFGTHQHNISQYDQLSGGLASKVIGNQLDSITAESLGLSNLSGDPKEIMEALENASKILNELAKNVENAYTEVSGGKTFDQPPHSTSIFRGDSSLNFFESQMEKSEGIRVDTFFTPPQMEKSYNIVDVPLKFNGATLNL